ncbi:MAG: hypothetical protein FWD57_10300 [Polyangiaceae bacterium]|nr:hypothetical protein [Polyangiaceae bacterium]
MIGASADPSKVDPTTEPSILLGMHRSVAAPTYPSPIDQPAPPHCRSLGQSTTSIQPATIPWCPLMAEESMTRSSVLPMAAHSRFDYAAGLCVGFLQWAIVDLAEGSTKWAVGFGTQVTCVLLDLLAATTAEPMLGRQSVRVPPIPVGISLGQLLP